MQLITKHILRMIKRAFLYKCYVYDTTYFWEERTWYLNHVHKFKQITGRQHLYTDDDKKAKFDHDKWNPHFHKSFEKSLEGLKLAIAAK